MMSVMCITVFTVWLNISMANKFTRVQSKSRYLELVNTLTPLTVLTAAEAKELATAGQELIGTNEELIYKYRDEFLHIQRVAEQGLTSLETLVDNPNELAIVVRGWGFTATVQDKIRSSIVYRKNLGQQDVVVKLSNILIDWLRPTTPTVDVAYYRQSGNLVALADSSILLPSYVTEENRLQTIKKSLGIQNNTAYYQPSQQGFSKTGIGQGGQIHINVLNGVTYYLTNLANGGSGYVVGDVIRFAGSRFGLQGEEVSDDVRITVSSVTRAGGIITSVTLAGTARVGRGYTILDLASGTIS
jgi:hypothetical protein